MENLLESLQNKQCLVSDVAYSDLDKDDVNFEYYITVDDPEELVNALGINLNGLDEEYAVDEDNGEKIYFIKM